MPRHLLRPVHFQSFTFFDGHERVNNCQAEPVSIIGNIVAAQSAVKKASGIILDFDCLLSGHMLLAALEFYFIFYLCHYKRQYQFTFVKVIFEIIHFLQILLKQS